MVREDKLISIIVPVYNVCKYLTECVDSLLRQSYKNIEIILVDDGSTDSSGVICDKYGIKDSRIRVIHKKNGGLSDARNVGLKQAKGEYIMFVDSDDFVNEFFVENMIYTILKDNSDLVICGYSVVDEEGNLLSEECNKIEEKIFRDKALFFLLQDELIKNYAWNKLYKRSLFTNIEFPVKKLFEDIYTIYKIILNCENISVIKNTLYCYRMRPGSIMQGININREMNSLDAKIQRYRDLHQKYPQYKTIMLDDIIDTCCCAYAIKVKTKNHIYDDEIKKHVRYVRKEKIFCKSKLSHKRRLTFELISYFPLVAKLLFSLNEIE